MSVAQLGAAAALALALTVLVAWLKQPRASWAVKRWHVVVPGVRISTTAAYTVLAERLKARRLAKVSLKQVSLFEATPFSFRRRYLRVKRGNVTFYILCSALDRRDFVVSYWLIPTRSLFLRVLAHVPGLRWLARVIYAWRSFDVLPRGDADIYFRDVVHRTVAQFAHELDPAGAKIRARSHGSARGGADHG